MTDNTTLSEAKRDGKAQAAAEKAYRKASRPWFKKKRFILPLILLVIIIISTAANSGKKDIFLEIDWMHGTSGGDHLHIPKLAALNAIGTTFSPHDINLHFDVGNNYQTSGSPYIIPAVYGFRSGSVPTVRRARLAPRPITVR